MRMRFSDAEDEREFLATKSVLLAEFAEWLEANRPPDEGETAGNADTFLTWRFNYSTGVLDDYRDDDLAEFLLAWCPRRLSSGPEYSATVCRSVAAFAEFLHATDRLVGGAARAARLIAHAHDLIPAMTEAMGDSSNFGMAKSLFSSALGGLDELEDLDDVDEVQAVLDAKMAAFNAMPFEERRAITDHFFERVAPVVELPFVHIAPAQADVDAAVDRVRLLDQIDALREFLGAGGRPLTPRGNLKLADGRALVELLETGDRVDETIHDRTFKTRSTDQLRGLVFVVDVAKEAGAVRLSRNRLLPQKRWASRTRLDQAAAVFRAIVELGPLMSHGRYSVPLYDRMDTLLDDGIPHWLAEMLAPGAVVPVDEIAEFAKSVVRTEIAPHFRVLVETLDDWAASGVCRIFGVLEQAGIVTWNDRRAVTEYGRSRFEGGQVELTALGRHLVPELLPAARYRLRTIGDLADASARDLIDVIDVAADDELEAMIASWRPGSSDAERAELLVREIGDATDGSRRLAGIAAIDLLDPAGAAPYVRQLLDSPAAGHAALWLMAHDLADESVVSRFVDVGTFIDILASTLDDPEELCELFLSAPDRDQPQAMLERMGRQDAPETAAVLDALGRHLPDGTLAKAARKAAMQHRSRNANRR